jgi:5-methylcytosine-specific restriction protein A
VIDDGGKRLDWTWDEIVLACDLTAENGWRGLEAKDSRVLELSALLRRLPIYPAEQRRADFRNPNGVGRKTFDIATRHPAYKGKPTNGGKTDRQVLAAFLARPEQMHQEALAIRVAERNGELPVIPTSTEVLDDPGAFEGRLLVRRHVIRERDRKLRQRKIDQVQAATGVLSCEICGFNFERLYGNRGAGYIECHHIVPLHVVGATTTKVNDLILLCANCHRMIHRQAPWLSPDDLRRLVEVRRQAGISAH